MNNDLTTLSLVELINLKEQIQNVIDSKSFRKMEIPEGGEDWIIDNGYIDQRDINYQDHRRGKNWIATVNHSPKDPGGLSRDFWNRGSGSFKEVPTIERNQVIEIAADYTSCGGNRSACREYYKIINFDDNKIIVKKTTKP